MQFMLRLGLASALLLLPGWARAQNIDAQASTVTVDRTSALADGLETVTVTVRVLKNNGQPFANRDVTLTLSGAENTVVQPGSTNHDGLCTGAVRTTLAGLKTVRATVHQGSHHVLLTAAPTVQFVSVADLRLDSLSPRFVPLAGAHTVTLVGRGFTRPGAGTPTVHFGTRPASSVVVVDDATLTCAAPDPDPTVGPVVDVTVTTALGAASIAGDLTYVSGLQEESFSSGVLPPWLQYPAGPMTIQGGVIRDPGNGVASRRMVRTVASDWIVRDFVLEVTLRVGATPPDGFPIPWVGIGRGDPDPDFFNEPIWALGLRIPEGSVRLAAHFDRGQFRVEDGFGSLPVGGTSRVRIVKEGATITWKVMGSWTPAGPFVPSATRVTDDPLGLLPSLGTDTSYLFFGEGTSTSSFDDLVVATLPPRSGIVSCEPHVGLEAGGTPVTIRGRGFLSGGAPTVRFGDRLATSVVVVDDETLGCVTPAADLLEPPFADVSVTNAHGTSALTLGWCYATQVQSEDFSGTTLPSWLEAPAGAFGFDAGQLRELDQTPDGLHRTYVRTVASDYHQRDFVYEHTLRVGRDWISFPGLGTGTPDLTADGEPLRSAHLRVRSFEWGSGHIETALHDVGRPPFSDIGESWNRGRRRLRMVKLGPQLSFEHMQNWPGSGAFRPEVHASIPDLAAAAPFLTEGRLFFGGQAPTFRYDDVVIGTLRPAVVHVASVFAAEGPTGGGVEVTVRGDGFSTLGAAPVVRFGGALATNVAVVDDTTLVATTPPHAAGSVAVVVKGALGAGLLLEGYRYVPGDAPPPPPAEARLRAVTPAYGLEAGGTAVTLRGTGFVAGASVTFDGRPATGVVVVSASEITCFTPAADPLAPPYVDVVVTDVEGASSLSHAFGYATDLKTEDFSTGVLPPWLEAPPGYFFIDGGSIHDESPNDQTNRRYCRTVDGGYWERDFAYELSVTVGPDYIVYPGIGSGEPDLTFFSEPVDALTFRLHSPNVSPEGGRIDVASYVTGGFFEFHTIGASQAYDVRRVRVLKQGSRAFFAHMGGWSPMKSFVSQQAHTFPDVTVSAPYQTGTNGHLMFGGGAPSFRFDDLLIATLRPSPVRVADVQGSSASGSTLTIGGSGFSTLGGSPQVRIGLLAATSVTVVSDVELTCVVPAGLPAQALLDLEVRGAAGSGLLFQAVTTP